MVSKSSPSLLLTTAAAKSSPLTSTTTWNQVESAQSSSGHDASVVTVANVSSSAGSSSSANTASRNESQPLAPSPPPALPALHYAAQTGDMATMYSSLGDDAVDSARLANETDGQGITALHWAAINNHVLACKLLLEKGADVDARGGDLNATPLQWAAR